MSLRGGEGYCDLPDCSDTYDREERNFYEVTTPDDRAFGSRYCSVNCAKIALMRIERAQTEDTE